jgi:hypothetical protein
MLFEGPYLAQSPGPMGRGALEVKILLGGGIVVKDPTLMVEMCHKVLGFLALVAMLFSTSKAVTARVLHTGLWTPPIIYTRVMLSPGPWPML